jgi:hypothetical protein
MAARERPIGWWLKHLDGLIEAAFDRALATERLSASLADRYLER